MTVLILRIFSLLILTTLVPIGLGVIFHFNAHPANIIIVMLTYVIAMVVLMHIEPSRFPSKS